MNVGSVNAQSVKPSFKGMVRLKSQAKYGDLGIVNFSNINGLSNVCGDYYLSYKDGNGEGRKYKLSDNSIDAQLKLEKIIEANTESDRTGTIVDVNV